MSHTSPSDRWKLLDQLRDAGDLFEELAAADEPELRLQERLRRRYPAELVRAALGQAELRVLAAGRFSRHHAMWLDREGLEQATAEIVARHKAQRFDGECWDFCCGIGGDSLALAERGPVRAVDIDPVRCRMCRWNAEPGELANRLEVIAADVASVKDRSRLVHIDPDRRAAGGGRERRSLRIEDGRPGLEFLESLMQEAPGGAVKLSAAANFLGKFPDTELELVSLDGECKQAIVWFGDLAGSVPRGHRTLWRATSLPSGETLVGDPLEVTVRRQDLGNFLYDPDPAIVRAGLVDLLAERLNLWRLDDREEYLAGDDLVESPFLRAFRVEAVLPYRESLLRRHLRDAGVGTLEIKCRHVNVNPDRLRPRLRLRGAGSAVLLIARADGKTKAVVAERVSRRSADEVD